MAGSHPRPDRISPWEDDAEVSARDLVASALTISDNAAADALIDLVGLASVDAFTRRLGLTETHLHATLRDTIDSIGRDAGFDDYAGRQQFWARISTRTRRQG